MAVAGVRVEMPTNQPIVLLKESGGKRYLPIWISPMAASDGDRVRPGGHGATGSADP